MKENYLYDSMHTVCKKYDSGEKKFASKKNYITTQIYAKHSFTATFFNSYYVYFLSVCESSLSPTKKFETVWKTIF